jgi:restriction endonuclease S subunit
LRPLAGYTLHDHKTNDSIRRELQTKSILDKIDEYRWNWLVHLLRMPQNQNPFKIIPLQTTRKNNNWKTEETLAGAFVTLETEQIKGSNP